MHIFKELCGPPVVEVGQPWSEVCVKYIYNILLSQQNSHLQAVIFHHIDRILFIAVFLLFHYIHFIIISLPPPPSSVLATMVVTKSGLF
jgi:hypothetical protein